MQKKYRRIPWYKKCRLIIIRILAAVVIFQAVFPACMLQVQAADKKLTLKQAQNLAIANSSNYKKILNKIELQEVKYATAVKSIKMKKKNMATFRWTPLLSFKFPEKPTLADEYEWQYKPLQITCTITQLKHQLQDDILASREKATLLYVETYICQEKIVFYEERLEKAKNTLQKNQIKLASGQASQADIDKMEQKVSKLTMELSLQMRTFENKKSELSKLIRQDITSGYSFTQPLVEADIPREILDTLIQYTLDNNQQYYEAKLETSLSLESMNMMERMMRNQYGGKMDIINPYLQQALNGEEIDSSVFKKAYKQLLQNVDAPWNGSIRILFIKINKEWFKGKISGSRYVEDDPYALYSAALEYADAVKEQESLKDELTKTVRNDFDALKTAQIAYSDGLRTCESLEQDVKKCTELNRLGSLTYEELSDLQQEYEEEEMTLLDTLAEYSKLLYSYDRLTCGGITAYLEGTDINMKAAQGGNSFLAEEVTGKAYYYIEYAVEDNLFRLGVSIPEDFSLEITHFALYVDGVMVGEKTELSKILEHLALDLDHTEQVQIFLYNEDELIEVCEIDASVYQDELKITGGYTLVEETVVKTVASYSYQLEETTNMVAFSIKPKDGEKIAFYQLMDEQGNCILGEDMIPVGESFRYLSLLVGDLSKIQVALYDKQESLLYIGKLETATASITVMQ